MRIAAPAVNPITTVCEIKFTSVPIFANPIISWNTPARNVSVSARVTNSALPGSARGLSAEKTTIEIAVVGPETRCFEEPQSAATTAGIVSRLTFGSHERNGKIFTLSLFQEILRLIRPENDWWEMVADEDM